MNSRRLLPVWRYIALAGAITVLGSLLVGVNPGRASQPFSPTLAVSPSSIVPGASASITLTSTVPDDDHALDSVNLILPPGWGIASDQQVPDGDVVGTAVIEADLGCDGSADPPLTWTLKDISTGTPSVRAEWRATSGSTSWVWRVVVDDLQSGETELSIILGNASMPTPICAPQTFTLTINESSSPSNSALLTNPSQGANYVWSAIYVSVGLQHVTSDSVAVFVGVPCPSGLTALGTSSSGAGGPPHDLAVALQAPAKTDFQTDSVGDIIPGTAALTLKVINRSDHSHQIRAVVCAQPPEITLEPVNPSGTISLPPAPCAAAAGVIYDQTLSVGASSRVDVTVNYSVSCKDGSEVEYQFMALAQLDTEGDQAPANNAAVDVMNSRFLPGDDCTSECDPKS